MPVFQRPPQSFLKPDPPLPSPHSKTMKPMTSEESVRAEYCDGPLPYPPSWHNGHENHVGQKSEGSSHSRAGVCTSDRKELMERIKRGESPTWVPSQTLQEEYSKVQHEEPSPPLSRSSGYESNPLLPPSDVQGDSNTASDDYAAELSPPSEIKRPRSALHAGDFTESSHDPTPASQQSTDSFGLAARDAQGIVGTSPTTPWFNPPRQYSHIVSPSPERPTSQRPRSHPPRNRAPSVGSLSSSYVAKAPTTPLIQQLNNTDLDFSPLDRSMSPNKTNRRHTLPPRTVPDGQEQPTDGQAVPCASAARQPPLLRRDSTIPYHAHRPRRSLTTTWSLQASPSSQKLASSRRQSFSSEASPLQNASMVGSYEESILRGWMSTAPSRPLNFTAQIGVMGRENCKPKCPAHVTVPFPAVFYSWNGAIDKERPIVDDEPSPYVGHIDLSQLPASSEMKKTRRSHSKSTSTVTDDSVHTDDALVENGLGVEHTSTMQKKRRRASPASADLQSGYRIPQKGQLQIVIKNPNKTAVKLFLVPYDLEDMQMGTKTFIRQRCFSTDPVIDGLTPSLARNPNNKKPALRYLIHLNVCSPSSGRFYLYQHIRVVFANRVPDNKEQLQTEIQIPQPRYSIYNPSISLSRSLSSSGAGLAREKAYRSRSSGFCVDHAGMDDRHPQALANPTSYPFGFDSPPPPVPSIPFHLPSTQAPDRAPGYRIDVTYNVGNNRLQGSGEGSPFPIFGGLPASPTPALPFARLPTDKQRLRRSNNENQRPAEDEIMDDDNYSRPTTASSQTLQSPLSDKTNLYRLHSKRSDISHSSAENGTFGKLSRGDVGYGGRPATPEPGAGLLARKLRGLGVGKEGKFEREGESEEG